MSAEKGCEEPEMVVYKLILALSGGSKAICSYRRNKATFSIAEHTILPRSLGLSTYEFMVPCIPTGMIIGILLSLYFGV